MKIASVALILAALGPSVAGSELALALHESRGAAILSSGAAASMQPTDFQTEMAKQLGTAQYCVPAEEDYDEGKIFCGSSS